MPTPASACFREACLRPEEPGLGTGTGGFIDGAVGDALCARLQGEGRGSPGGVETGERAD